MNKLTRYGVKMINKADRTETVHTFTWAENHLAAQTRLNREMARNPQVWDGWTYELTI